MEVSLGTSNGPWQATIEFRHQNNEPMLVEVFCSVRNILHLQNLVMACSYFQLFLCRPMLFLGYLRTIGKDPMDSLARRC